MLRLRVSSLPCSYVGATWRWPPPPLEDPCALAAPRALARVLPPSRPWGYNLWLSQLIPRPPPPRPCAQARLDSLVDYGFKLVRPTPAPSRAEGLHCTALRPCGGAALGCGGAAPCPGTASARTGGLSSPCDEPPAEQARLRWPLWGCDGLREEKKITHFGPLSSAMASGLLLNPLTAAISDGVKSGSLQRPRRFWTAHVVLRPPPDGPTIF